ncbi:MAG: FIST C-terminal domain-containing protein [Planctomycetes bacterium]|nr:FIST C-terminal domain-containing protein [Planctomycetota bacterium]
MKIPPTPFFATALSAAQDVDQIVEDICQQVAALEPNLLLFFSGTALRLDELSSLLSHRFPNTIVAGCTTCGEISEGKCLSETTVAMALGDPIRVSVKLVSDLGAFRFDDGPSLLQSLAADLDLSLEQLQEHSNRYLLITLTDGLTAMEEILIAALLTAAPELQLVGGGAGDGFRFKVTRVAVGGKVARHAAAVILLEPNLAFHPFHLHHFHTTGRSFVVTEADPGRRFINRIDGKPAAEFLADLLGRDLQEFLADATTSVVFGVHSGKAVYLRSVMRAFPDKLLMGGAIEEGTVLHLMAHDKLVERTQQGLQDELAQVQDPAAMLLFSCGGRHFDAVASDCVEELGRCLCPIPTVGFSTYGEQFGSMQVNHTLTGLILGAPK